MVEAIDLLMRLCFMALAGSEGVEKTSRATVQFALPSMLRSKAADPKEKHGTPGVLVSPVGSSASASRGQSERDDSSVEVRCIALPRAEEVEAVWLETCKALADLVGSVVPDASFRASYSLEVW